MVYNTVAQAEAWAIAHPTKNVGKGGPSWESWCAALMFWAGNFDTSCDTAEEGSRNSGIVSTDPFQAPRGAFHWWEMGWEGHVALDLDGGGSRLLMASSAVSNYGDAIGTISWSAYGGSEYVGWSLDFVGQKLADVGQPGPGTGGPTGMTVEQGKIIQRVAERGQYSGPIDGHPGVNTWIGVQKVVQHYGYQGPTDGYPGINTYKGLQELAKQEGNYSGPVDGILGPNTFAALEFWLSKPSAPSGPAGVYGIDVGTTQRDLDFAAIRAAGYQFAMVKAGGTNVSPIYTAPYYHQQIARARSAGLVIGHYWVAGSTNPANDANYFVDHLFDYRPGDLLVLDNEAIDDGIFWNDSLTATFMQTVKNRLGVAPFLYTYSSLLTSNTWTQTRAIGSKLWIAHYTTAANPTIGSAFPTWEIHQYTDSGSQNGIPLDLDIAKLSAFEGFSQPPYGLTGPPPGAMVTSGGGTPSLTFTQEQGMVLQNLAGMGGYDGPVDGDLGVNSWRGVQQALRDLGHYDGPVDGVPGGNTYKGIQLLADEYGYDGPIDGVPGTYTIAGIQNYLNTVAGGVGTISYADQVTLQKIARAGGYTGPVDGAMGTNSWRGVQQALAGYGYSGPTDGGMGVDSWKAVQRLAAKGGYAGVVDGEMGANSWKGVQTILAGFGYTGPIDGAPGTNTFAALQRLARLGGYEGPADGVMGVLSWKGLQTFLSGSTYTGPTDGVPGSNTYKALQVLASRGGYGGPVDGIPGPNTFAGLASLVA